MYTCVHRYCGCTFAGWIRSSCCVHFTQVWHDHSDDDHHPGNAAPGASQQRRLVHGGALQQRQRLLDVARQHDAQICDGSVDGRGIPWRPSADKSDVTQWGMRNLNLYVPSMSPFFWIVQKWVQNRPMVLFRHNAQKIKVGDIDGTCKHSLKPCWHVTSVFGFCVKCQDWILWQDVVVFTLNACIFKNWMAKLIEKRKRRRYVWIDLHH